MCALKQNVIPKTVLRSYKKFVEKKTTLDSSTDRRNAFHPASEIPLQSIENQPAVLPAAGQN